VIIRLIKTTMSSPAQVQQYLAGADYPSSREELLQHAEDMGAPQEVVEALEGIADKEYRSPADLMEELGATAL
jgi:hypothetical protein